MKIDRVAKWGLKSVGGLAVNVALLTLWVDYVGLSPALAIIPNFIIISAVGYTVTNHWIFADGVTPTTLRGHATQYTGMQAANLVGKAANYLLYLLLLPLVAYQVAWVVGAVVTFGVTFSLNRWWWTSSRRVAA